MGFPYIIELENVDTNEKIYHSIGSSKPEQVFNSSEQINYNSVLEFILMYEPQSDKQMLLIMYQQNDLWIFMTSEFFIDLSKLNHTEEHLDKTKISKLGSKISPITNSQIIHPNSDPIKNPDRHKIILSVRFQCQLWVDQPDNFWEKSLISQKSFNSQKESTSINLIEKVKQISYKIKQIDEFAHELQQIQAEALGINIFWASPYFATDGIVRKQPKGQQKKRQQLKEGKKDYLKNSVKCIPYVNAITQQIVQSKKKVVLNIDQFNNLSFARRNIFKVVYLVCHTQVTEVKQKQYQQKFKRFSKQNYNETGSSISDGSFKNQFFGMMEQIKVQSIKIDKLQHIVQRNDEENQEDLVKIRRTDSIEIQEINSFLGLERIQEEKESDNMTERKESIDLNALKDCDPVEDDLSHSLHRGISEQIKHNSFFQNKIQKSAQKIISQESYLEKAFDIKEGNNTIFSAYQQDQFQFERAKDKMSKTRRNRLSRSNSRKSTQSKGNQNTKRSKSKRNFEQQSAKIIFNVYKQKVQENGQNDVQFDLKNSIIKKTKRYDKKQKKQYKKSIKTVEVPTKEENEKQTITYLIGQNKLGQLQKITPQDLDEMLSEKKLEKIQLFIIHTSYPSTHLPVLKNHANNILVINSNPMYPEACTVFYLKYFFKHLFQLKNIRLAHQKSLLETIYLYKGDTTDFRIQKMLQLYSVDKNSLQKVHFEPFMNFINKKYIHGGPYLCCCYHPHQYWCTFRTNKSTSKYAECHYKFHINRCQCKFPNPMNHSCEEKRQTLSIYNIIDKKKYQSPTFYDCCCLGVKLGRYKHKRKNTQCALHIDQQTLEDPHDVSQKYIFINSTENQDKPKLNKNTTPDLQKSNSFDQKTTELLSIEDGVVQGSCNPEFLDSLKYLSENDLIGNSQIIVQSLFFFGGNYEGAPNQSEIRGDFDLKRNESKVSSESNMTTSILTASQKPHKMTNSMIRQSIMTGPKNEKNEDKNIYSNQPRICNLHGENSSGRKTIGKYLGHLMIVKNMYQKIQIKYFTRVEDLKFLEIEPKVTTFYILIYKSAKRHQQINLDQISLTADNLPPSINAIIITNKKINFDKSIIHVYKTPKPFNKQQIQTYIKMYEHLSGQEKLKLKTFMDLTDLNIKDKNKPDDQNEQSITKIYANRIDPYEIISVIRKSNYSNLKYLKYLESVSKINSRSLPQYLFIAGTLYEALKYYQSMDSRFMKKQKNYFISKITQKLKAFISDNKSFYLFFDPKRNKNKSKNLTEGTKQQRNRKQMQKKHKCLEDEENEKAKQSQSQKEKTYKEDVIRAIDVSQFFILNFQKFRKQISSRPLDALKYFIYYTTLHQKNIYSLKESYYSKGCQNLQKQKSAQETTNFYTRKIAYEHEFYESTSHNQNSFLFRVLRKQIQQYATFLQPINQSSTNKFSNLTQNSTLKRKQENRILINLQRVARQANQEIFEHQKSSMNQFFSFYSLIFKERNSKTTKNESYERKDSFSPENPFLKERHSELTPNKESYQSPTTKHPRSQSCVLARSEKKQDYMQEDKKNRQKWAEKESYLDFKNEQLHICFIMSAGLTYLRSILCSHLVYNLLDSKTNLSVIKAGLILINNALILMKTPDFKIHSNLSHLQDLESQSQCNSYDINQASVQSQNQQQNQNVSTFQRSESILLQQNLESFKTKSSHLGFSQTLRHKSTLQEQKSIQNLEKDLNNLFSIKGLLYLLFKIRQRCDGLILIFTNDNSHLEVQQMTKMCIISELLMLQLHIMNLSQGQNYQSAISNINSLSKSQKYLTSIFFDKNRSLNYIRESLHFAKFTSEEEEMIQNHFLSAYIMIATNYGRKSINESLSHQISKIKSEFDDKSGRKESIHEIVLQNKIQDSQLSDKMKILLKISQNRQIFYKVFSIFLNFKVQQAIQVPKLESLKKGSNQNKKQRSEQKISESKSNELDQTIQRGVSNRIKQKNYENQIELFLELIYLYHQFERSLQQDSASIYLSMEKFQNYLLNESIIHGLKFCSRYVNAFHQDFLNRIQKHNLLLKEKLVLFFTADPIQFNKSATFSSSKEHFETNEQFQINKKKIQYEGNNKTIILGCDVSELQNKITSSKSNSSPLRDSVLETTFMNDGTSTNFNETLSRKESHIDKPSYNFFTLNKKLNEKNLKDFSKSFGCKYLCIDTMMCLNNQKNQMIGETEEGEMVILRKERLRQLIQQLSVTVVFICLHNGYLAKDLINKWTKKEIIYFNFEKVNESLERKISSESQISSTSIFKEFKSGMLYTYYRMIMRKVVHLIVEKLVEDSSNHSHSQKIVDSLSFVLYTYEFCIKNAAGDTIFSLSSSQLRNSIFTLSKFTLHPPECLALPKKIILLQEDIVSIEEVQQVKTVLKQKYNTKDQKEPVRIEHIKSFEKFFKIFKFYLKDKENYKDFFEIDLEKFKHPNKDGEILLRNIKSDQSYASIPQSLTKGESNISKESKGSTDRKKKEKKNRQPKYTYRWKSEFMKYLLKQNLLNLYLSNKKCFVMFSNSDLMAQKAQKQDWARDVFDDLFRIDNCDTGEQLHRIVTEVKIGIPKKGEKKPSKIATLFFMETKKPQTA